MFFAHVLLVMSGSMLFNKRRRRITQENQRTLVFVAKIFVCITLGYILLCPGTFQFLKEFSCICELTNYKILGQLYLRNQDCEYKLNFCFHCLIHLYIQTIVKIHANTVLHHQANDQIVIPSQAKNSNTRIRVI
jgi:hypothetical protein